MAEKDLYEAVKVGNADKVSNLLERPGMQKSVKKMYDGDSETLPTLAARCRNPALIALLHQAGADLNKRNFSGKAPLHLTSFEGDVKMTKALLQCGADINNPDDCGKMPLHWAVSRNKGDVIRALADGGANVDAKTKKGVTLLHEAILEASDDTVKALVQKSASLESLNADQDTVLQAVIKAGREQVLDIIITERGMSVYEETANGETVLHLCAAAGKQSIAVYLIEKHDVKQEYINKQTGSGTTTSLKGKDTDTSGWTALHFVCALGLVRFVEYLLDKGGDKKVKTAKGETAADIATCYEQDKVLPLLGVKVESTPARRGKATFVSGSQAAKSKSKSKSGHWNL